jgi:tRNA dimethylallyltransferase
MKYAVTLSRHALNQAIVNRTEKMIAGGIIDETRKLLEQYPDARCLNSIGYAEVKAFLNKKITEKQLRNEIIEKTRQLAKRQVTWLRSDPEVRFVDFRDQDRICLEVENLTAALNE